MKQILKTYFIPHEGNNYHPHILHTKRAIFYSSVFLFTKIIVVIFAISLPFEVFMLPDSLKAQQGNILALTNTVREGQGLAPLAGQTKLYASSQMKVEDMAEQGYFAHRSPSGVRLQNWLEAAGYAYDIAGENLAMGYSTAQAVVDAWVRSPTHYDNIIDPEYTEFGIGTQSGKYEELTTSYVAMHFGKPKEATAAVASVSGPVAPELSDETPITEPAPESIDQPREEIIVISEQIPQELVAGEHEIAPVKEEKLESNLTKEPLESALSVEQSVDAGLNNEQASVLIASLDASQQPEIDKENKKEEIAPTIGYNRDISRIYWEEKDGKTVLTVGAYIVGNVSKAAVHVYNYDIELLPTENPFIYYGQIEIFESSDSLFKVVLTPAITITSATGEKIEDSIMWNSVKIVSPSSYEKYEQAKTTLSAFTSIFKVSRGIYLGFIVFFGVALVINIFVEIKKQHHHVIAQTVLLIGLLVALFEV